MTNSVAILPGYVGGSIAYREELVGQGGRIRHLGAVGAVGAIVGAALLLVSPESLFRSLVPFLILFSCLLLFAQPALARSRSARAGRPPATLLPLQFAASLYGGFGAGLGILMLALLGIYLDGDLHELNALKGTLSLIISVIAAAFFAVFGPVVWTVTAATAVASLLGGRLGLGRRSSAATCRATSSWRSDLIECRSGLLR